MSLEKIKRRDFLKIMGWSGAGATLVGCDMPTTVTLEEGAEEVVSYLAPEEYVIPGVGVWFASTCLQCPSACGVHGRVREGRVLKLEGNPDSSVNKGKLCQMGQSALQGHYNPDRITQPRARKNGVLTDISWQEALKILDEKTGSGSALNGNRVAWMTGNISGHQAVLVDAYLAALGSKNHYVFETINDAVWRAVSRDMLGVANPQLQIERAQAVLSFGADFLGTWGSPVHYAQAYSKFRSSPRGMLIQAEPKMTLTGANADLWLPVNPGTEGVLALGIAQVLMTRHGVSNVPAEFKSLIKQYDLDKVSRITGITGEHILRTAQTLKERSPSLVLAGASAQGHEQGYQTVAAVMMLNIMLGNIGKTITGGTDLPFAQMRERSGDSKSLLAFADAVTKGQYDVAFFYAANPVFQAPEALRLNERLANVKFKVAMSQFEDETTLLADLVLPLASPLEDWGTHVAPAQFGESEITMQQPLMERIHKETRGFGDIMLSLLKMRNNTAFTSYDDYYAYLHKAISNMPGATAQGGDNWMTALQKGVLKVNGSPRSLQQKSVSINLSEPMEDQQYPYHLIPSGRLGLWDGRHANLPWLQEAPDQISKVVWDSWAEIHPKTAAKLGLKQGDALRITSENGTIEAKVYIYKGISENAVAVPLGQGHTGYGRYAKGVGVNPLKIVSPLTDSTTGELALFATRVQLAKGSMKDKIGLVRLGGSETQVGRKIVATVSADVYERTEGGA